MKHVIVVIGTGSIGQAVARRVSAGKHVLLADLRDDNAEAAAKTLADAGLEREPRRGDVCSRPSVRGLGEKVSAVI
jgi:NAD(P)-dependent dehydrogenase (short-subunit alcohol dehydrogenase family)